MSIANELITRGWHQGGLMGPDGSVCLAGAAATLAGYGDRSREWDKELFDRGFRAIEELVGFIKVFNDAPDRTIDEVLRVAKLADEILDER